MSRPFVSSIVLLSLGGCSVGPSVTSFAPASRPQGVRADLHLHGSRVQGELLEVQDSGLVVLRGGNVAFVPLPAIEYGNFRQRGTLIQDGKFVDERAVARLRLVSRYPAGLTQELRARLLAAYGQAEPVRVTP